MISRRAGAERCHRAHLSGAENQFELYTALSSLYVPVVERMAASDPMSLVTKINGNGAVTWQLKQSLLGDRQAYGQGARKVHRAKGGGYLIEVGRYHSTWLVKLDESGAMDSTSLLRST